jgi:WXG100 family type VII secretion target
MAATASKFEQVDGALGKMLKDLMGELDLLRSKWSGAGGRSFDAVRIAWANDQDKLHKALAQTATAIRTAGKDYTASDESSASRFKSGPNVALPL